MLKSFIAAYLDGEATAEDIGKWVEQWEQGVKDHTRMSFIGLDWPEPYKTWCYNPTHLTKVLKMIDENYEGVTLKELNALAEKAKFSGWERDKGAKIILKLIAEIRRLRAKLGMDYGV